MKRKHTVFSVDDPFELYSHLSVVSISLPDWYLCESKVFCQISENKFYCLSKYPNYGLWALTRHGSITVGQVWSEHTDINAFINKSWSVF